MGPIMSVWTVTYTRTDGTPGIHTMDVPATGETAAMTDARKWLTTASDYGFDTIGAHVDASHPLNRR